MSNPCQLLHSPCRRPVLFTGLAVVAAMLVAGLPPARAQQGADQAVLLLRVQQLEKELAQIKAQLVGSNPVSSNPVAFFSPAPTAIAPPAVALLRAAAVTPPPPSAVRAEGAAAKHGFLERKPGKDLTFLTPNGQLTLYGNLDVSVDSATKGIHSVVSPDGSSPMGQMGW